MPPPYGRRHDDDPRLTPAPGSEAAQDAGQYLPWLDSQAAMGYWGYGQTATLIRALLAENARLKHPKVMAGTIGGTKRSILFARAERAESALAAAMDALRAADSVVAAATKLQAHTESYPGDTHSEALDKALTEYAARKQLGDAPGSKT